MRLIGRAYFSIVFFLILTVNTVLGQQKQNIDSCDFYIEGRVRDLVSNEPLPYANIQLSIPNKGAVSDIDGKFLIENLCQREFDIEISFVGYKTVLHHHDDYHKVPTIFLAPDDMVLEGVVIEGENYGDHMLSTPLSRIDSDEIRKADAGNIGELSQKISGVRVLQTGQNIMKPMIHGLHSNRVLLINNGVRHEFQNWGAEHAPEIDPSSIESLEVIKGAATVRYGPEALGGVLLLEPAKLELHTGYTLSTSLNAKSNGRSSRVNIKSGYGGENWAFNGGFSGELQGDLSAPDYVLTNTSKREWNVVGEALYHKEDLEVSLFASHFYQNLGILRGSITGNLSDLLVAMQAEKPAFTSPFSYNINNPRQLVEHDLVKMNVHRFWNDHLFDISYAYQRNHRREFDVRRGTNNDVPSIDLVLQTHSMDLQWMPPEISETWEISSGLQFSTQSNENQPGTNTIPFIPNFTNLNLGAYSINTWTLSKSTLELGLRYDVQMSDIIGRDIDNSLYFDKLLFNNLTASFGFTKEISEKLLIRSNIGSAWRPPSISELYIFGKHQASIEYGLRRYRLDENNKVITNNVTGSFDSDPLSEIGWKWINTLEFSNSELRLNATGYINYINNFIYSSPVGITNTVRGAFPYFIYRRSNALFYGADLDLEWKNSANLKQVLRSSFVMANRVPDQERFVGIPPARITWTPTFNSKIKSWNLELAVSIDYTLEQNKAPSVIGPEQITLSIDNDDPLLTDESQIFDFQEPPSDYLLVNSYMQLSKKHWRFKLGVDNLLNETYRIYTDRMRYFADQTGRNFTIALHYTL